MANTTHLANPFSIISRPTIDIFPLAFELPSRFLPFVKILKDMGLHDTLSISSGMYFLWNYQKSSGNDRLNPNELRAALEILHFIYNEIIEQQTSDLPADWQSALVVPDDGCRLVQASSSAYIDPYGSQYVKLIDSSKLNFVHRDVSDKSYLALGIRKLSDVVVEVLDLIKLYSLSLYCLS